MTDFEEMGFAIVDSITLFVEPSADADTEADSQVENAQPIAPGSLRFTAADGSLSLDYPSEWQIGESDGLITLVSPEGTMAVLTTYPLSDVEDIATDATPLDVLQTRLAENSIPRSEPIEFTAGEHLAAREDVTGRGSDASTIIVFVSREDEPLVGEMSIFTGPNQLIQIQPVLLDILASLAYND